MDQRLADEELAPVLEPVATARGLPNRHYVDQTWFETERDRLFFDGWAGIGFAKDVPAKGDAMPITFLGQPLVAIRGRDGKLRVFLNICRHRGMILIREPGPIRGAIRCPYHSWCYDLDGALKATPHVGGPGHNSHEAIRREDLGLVEIPSYVWRDVVFVNISGEAPPFETAHRAAIERWREFGTPLLHSGADSGFTLDVATNWKLAVENYCESYHLPWVHPGLNSYSRLEDHYNIEEPDAFSGQGTLVYRQLADEDGLVFPDAPGLGDRWQTAAEYIAFYPNVLFGVHRDHSFAILLEPVAIDRTVEHVEIYYHAEEALDADHAGLRARNSALWETVFKEDIFVVEGMQRGRHASGFDGGKFSPVMDSPTHMFHRWVASRLA
ncbi:MAG: (2Fe-2S)-binding protein [Ahrensia sp.]|nr:(2Fe-2S)-binding protein [Ahrensia sp.]